MVGYFISKNDADKLKLFKNLELKKCLQETYFVVAENDIDISSHNEASAYINEEISNFLNKNYFDSMIEIVFHLLKNKS